MNADSQPVIIGVAQQVWRDGDVQRTPVDALQDVICAALSDTGSERVIGAVDRMVHVPFIMTQVPTLAGAMPRNAGAAVAERLGIKAKQFGADVGGNLPQQFVNEFATRLQEGDGEVVLLCGVELLASFLGAVRSGQPFPDWATGIDHDPHMVGATPSMTAPTEHAHGLFEPINAYPLFESALRHAKGLSAQAHHARLGQMIASMSEVAAANPYAWKPQRFSAAEVLSTDAGNRMISYPYTKLMNSVIAVDQAAALVLTTRGKARELGVDPERLIYLRGGAHAHEPWFLSERAQLARSPALAAAGGAALAQAGLSIDEMDCFDLYSCFPAAVQIACDALGLDVEDPRGLTLTGGMMLFGGAGNNYTLHGIAEMVSRLRSRGTGRGTGAGLVTANGGFVTKHAVGVYATEPAAKPAPAADLTALQAALDSVPRPKLTDKGDGTFTLVAHTVRFKGDAPSEAIALGTLASGERCVAVSKDEAVIERFLQHDCIGEEGAVVHKEGLNYLSL